MPDVAGTARSPLDGLLPTGRHGRSGGTPGLVIAELSNIALASVIARKDKVELVGEMARRSFQVDLPHTPRRVEGRSIEFLWAGPQRWLAVARGGYKPGEFEAALARPFFGLASVAEQSDGRTLLQISGACARDVLAKALPIDLHPRVFRKDDTALTVAAHIGLQIWQSDDAPTYEMFVPRSFAGSFLRFLSESAAEHGYELARA